MTVPYTFRPNDVLLIFCADNEWGNELMLKLAREAFDANPSLMFVEVYEHAGWSLGWRRDGSVWTTANDMAVLKPGTKAGQIAYSVRRQDNGDHTHTRYPSELRLYVA